VSYLDFIRIADRTLDFELITNSVQLQRLGLCTKMLFDSSKRAREHGAEAFTNYTRVYSVKLRESDLLNGDNLNLLINTLNDGWHFEVSQWPERAAALLDWVTARFPEMMDSR
jgi:hypothetical protein